MSIKQIVATMLRQFTASGWLDESFTEDVILKQERFEPTEWVRPIERQVKLLEEVHLVGAKIDRVYFAAQLRKPSPVGFFKVAVPKFEFLGRLYGVENPYSRIGILIEHVCELLAVQREGRFTHYRKGQLQPERVQCVSEIVERRKQLEALVPGDIMVLSVCMGSAYAGWTPRRARERIIRSRDQLAMAAVDVGWILLLNPDRFQRNIDLSVDTVMEEYCSDDRGWSCALFFYYRSGKLEFGYRWNRRAYFDCGAVVAAYP